MMRKVNFSVVYELKLNGRFQIDEACYAKDLKSCLPVIMAFLDPVVKAKHIGAI